MKIHPDKQAFGIAAFVFICCVCMGVLLLSETGNAVPFGILLGIGIMSGGLWLIAFGRHFELDQQGIHISFLLFHKTVPWGDVTRINIVDTSRCMGYRFSPSQGVEIYFKNGSRPVKQEPNTYCLLRRPMSYVFISFKGTIQHHNVKYPEYYTADQNQLLDILRKYARSSTGDGSLC